ncbi:tyrosine-type recombinase/integrase [Actinopolyspora xinjiangensis]|uniref:tyrosine-type recombinase/integrase n=1 Tax=Actinopolyspora xinjiangensis TaxID=405564 RepID=UPI003CC7A427
MGYWWRAVREAAGCEDVRRHDLRHFYASRLIASGCDVVTVQRALGHSTPSITLHTYSHSWPSAEGRTREAAARTGAEVWGDADEHLTNDESSQAAELPKRRPLHVEAEQLTGFRNQHRWCQ